MEEFLTRCPNCGGKLTLSADHTKQVCPFCESIFLTGLDPVEQKTSSKNVSEEKEFIDDTPKFLNNDPVSIVKQICESHESKNMYIHCGSNLKANSAYSKARMNFGIPSGEEIYFIFDATVFGSCKTGFALCTNGIYYNAGWSGGKAHLTWDEVIKTSLHIKDGSIYIGEQDFITGGASQELLALLTNVQKSITSSN